MLGAYGWAFVNPIRKLFYNLTITLISVVVAVVVGSIEVLGLVAGRPGSTGVTWDTINLLADNFSSLGYLVVGVFMASWFVSFAIYRSTENEGSV
jgi:high-affinity nickel-transport protein